MRAVKSVSIDSERRVIITFLDGSTETLYPNCIWCDSEALRQLIKDLLEEKADAITQTIENVTIATFADGADEALIKKLLVNVDPIQEGSGDPSTENVRPISGRTGLSVARTGKNLLDNTKIVQGTFVTPAIMNSIHTEEYLPIKGNETYVWYTPITQINGRYIAVYNSNHEKIEPEIKLYGSGQKTFTTPENAVYFKARWYRSDSDIVPDEAAYDQIELGSVATEYEPYKGDTYTINWETEAGTVYGGSLDVVSGKLMVNMVGLDLSNLTYTIGSSGGVNVFRSNINSIPVTDNNQHGLCSIYPFAGTRFISNMPDKSWMIDGTGRLNIRDNSYTTVESFIASLTEGQIIYYSTPTEIQLTQQEITTLLGTNNIWADSGDILELEYVADTKLYIGESQSGTLGSGRQTITKPEIQPISDKTVEDITETEEKETQEETEDE